MEVVIGSVIAVKSGCKLLLLRRAEEDGKGLWEFPKGAFDTSDVTIHETARRELREETGLDATGMEYIGDIERSDGRRKCMGYAYVVYGFRGKVRLSEEHDDYRWVDRGDIGSYKLDVNTLAFLKLYKDF
jgi:8-oxo-dGTP diphosphatase